jgi:hypothetical protein
MTMGDFGDDIRSISLIPAPVRDDYGTRASALYPAVEIATELNNAEQIRADALARVEGKLDALVEGVVGLQRRIDSIDAVLARIVAQY